MSGERLRLEGLTKRHPGAAAAALQGIDLEVRPGAILVLLGKSGAGKTTLLRIVCGLEQADRGRVWVGERLVADPGSRVPPERRGVGLVFQHLELWPHMSVAENVAFGLPGRPRGQAAREHPVVRTLARRVGIEALLARRPANLSGGERQRVAIARTLAPRPSVVLYDEPLANLDPERRADLRRLVRDLAREDGATVLYVTHDADEAMAVADEIAVLANGRLVDRGAPEALYRQPTTVAGARALGPVTALPARLEADRALTVLGALAPAARDLRPGAVEGARAIALVRPEAVLAGQGGVEAEVVDARPQGPGWRVRYRVGDVEVEGHAPERAPAGTRTRLRVEGPVAVVSAEDER